MDQIGNTVGVDVPAGRIISLVPSQTELLCDLDLDERLVGVTRFCVHPAEKCRTKAFVGGTKKFDFKKIRELNPTLILANKEENYQQGIERLRTDYPVWVSDVENLDAAIEMIATVGAMTGSIEKCEIMIGEILTGFSDLAPDNKISAAYLIWRNPFMVAAGQTFINDMITRAGFLNVFGDMQRYPEITWQQLREARPGVIFLSSEPYPFRERHLPEFREILPDSLCLLVDGTLFSWYGSRLRKAPDYFRMLHSEVINQTEYPGA